MPAIIDFILVFIIAIVFPALGWHEYRKFKRLIAAGDQRARSREYVHTILWQWGLSAAVGVVWTVAGRSWGDLGFAPEFDWSFGIGVVLTFAATLFLVMQQHTVRRAEGEKAQRIAQQLRGQLEPVRDILPHTPKEARLFHALSITAGICEEFLYRAYLIWFLASYFGLIAAATVSVVIFAAAHLYQGVKMCVRILFVGAAMTGLYLLTDCIWLPMLLHATIDVTSGLMAYHILRDDTTA